MSLPGRIIASVAAAALLAAGLAAAQTYPAKSVRVLIPWPPGGSNDIVGRIVFQKVSEQSGQQFVIDNRAGAAGTIGALIPQINAKQVRPLGVTSAARMKQFPDVPTLAEAGVSGYEFTAWIGAFAPAGTPRPVLERLGAEIKQALEHPDVARIMSSQTLDPWFMTPEEFAQRLKSDDEKYEKLFELTGAIMG